MSQSHVIQSCNIEKIYIISHAILYHISLSKFKIKKIKMKSKTKINKNKNKSICSQFFAEDFF